MLWSIFTYIITHHVLGEFSGLINGLIAAAIVEPTAKSNVKRTRMFVLPLSRHYITIRKSATSENRIQIVRTPRKSDKISVFCEK